MQYIIYRPALNDYIVLDVIPLLVLLRCASIVCVLLPDMPRYEIDASGSFFAMTAGKNGLEGEMRMRC